MHATFDRFSFNCLSHRIFIVQMITPLHRDQCPSLTPISAARRGRPGRVHADPRVQRHHPRRHGLLQQSGTDLKAIEKITGCLQRIHWIKKIHALLLQILYLDATKKTVDYLTDAVEVFVGKELTMFENQRTIPFVVFITLVQYLLSV